jgi:hypothetical protein
MGDKMARKTKNGRVVTFFHVFPGIILATPTATIGHVVIKRKDQVGNEPRKNSLLLDSAFSLFKDIADNTIETGSYIADEDINAVEEVWSLLRYAAYLPREDEEVYKPKHRLGMTDWFSFYTPQSEVDPEKNYEIFSIDQNGIELWSSFPQSVDLRCIHRKHKSDEGIHISKDGLKTSQKISVLFSKVSEYDVETIKLSERIKKAIYWYNKSFELTLCEKPFLHSSVWDLESELLYMAIAFETLFQPSKIDIQKHLETSLKVIFPDNEFVPKWLTQFYSARSTIAHGSSIDQKDIEFKPDKIGHKSLNYWSRKIFRACIEAIVSQWETAAQSGLLSAMTPNRIRLNRVYGKIRSIPEDMLFKSIPEEIRGDIRDFHSSWLDTPSEEFLSQTYNVGNILARVAQNSEDVKLIDLRTPFMELLALPKDWYKEQDKRLAACEIYADILILFGDEANILNPLVELANASPTEKTLYHWAKFAYGHIWSIDL